MIITKCFCSPGSVLQFLQSVALALPRATPDLRATRRCGSVYLAVVLDISECIYLGNLHGHQFRV